MPEYHFDRFMFDPQQLELRFATRHVALRPKTAQMLRVLLESRGEIVSKRELILAVWHTEHVTDQSLFQAMSELRRILAPLDAIKTHPNLGYQWVAGVDQRGWRRWRAAASITVMTSAAALAAVAFGFFAATPSQTAQAAPQLPALQALASGMTSLRANRLSEAEQQFALAVTENPRFREARLLLAETWLAQGQVVRARAAASALLEEDSAGQGTYVNMAAMDLLSRSSQRAGMHGAALDWAESAADSARSEGYMCAAAELEDRLSLLIAGDEKKVSEAQPQQSPVLAAQGTERPAHCNQISRDPGETGHNQHLPATPSRLCARPETIYQSMV